MASHNEVSRVAKSAVLTFLVTFLIGTIAFSTNSWLETDGELENPKFIKLGERPGGGHALMQSTLGLLIFIVYI